MAESSKTIVGLTEKIEVIGKKKTVFEVARIDTGATKGSIDTKLAASLGLGPIIRTKLVKSASGQSTRPLVHVDVKIKRKRFTGDFTIADRSHMKFKVLIGQDILTQGFLIDPSKKYEPKKKVK